LRCRKCRLVFMQENKKGRNLPICKECGKQLSAKKNTTGLCRTCSYVVFKPWNKGITGITPWNKGKSLFKNKDEYRIYLNRNRKEKRKYESIQEKLSDRIRTLIRNHIIRGTGKRKAIKTEELLGCTHKFFKEYLQNLFGIGMSWENYGNGKEKWNIDHIRPVSRFDLTSIEEQKKAFHFSNCQPMWSLENIKKGNRVL